MQTCSTLKKESQMAPDGDRKVSIDRIYRSQVRCSQHLGVSTACCIMVPIRQNNPDEEVSPEDRVKAYRYGKEQVPFSKEDEAQLKLSTEKCLRCGCDLCCSPEYNLPVSVQTYCIHRRGQNQE